MGIVALHSETVPFHQCCTSVRLSLFIIAVHAWDCTFTLMLYIRETVPFHAVLTWYCPFTLILYMRLSLFNVQRIRCPGWWQVCLHGLHQAVHASHALPPPPFSAKRLSSPVVLRSRSRSKQAAPPVANLTKLVSNWIQINFFYLNLVFSMF